MDFILHFNKVEALGRILLESIDFGMPSICFNEGGTGEVANMLGLTDFVIDGSDPDWPKLLLDRISKADDVWSEEKYSNANVVLTTEFSPEKYTTTLENLLCQK